jgi:hypothetical protein
MALATEASDLDSDSAFGPPVIKGIRLVGEQLQVERVHTSANVADVIHDHPGWDRLPVDTPPRNSVGCGHDALTVFVPSDLCVSVTTGRVGADPTVPVKSPLRQHPIHHSLWEHDQKAELMASA